ncbi:MAG: Membrane protein insertase YidC [Microgenomates group bacterium GW2011_GWC2_45_8]|nr:MAG: Membrane protein insertase YidC [Microgenomates group bacterium GW2011_GWC2_45_8]KKU26091.1 MAG: Membrane protein insertase YidC [Microgenomates group bacterium GW2011_GWA2_46_16]
MFEHYIYQPFFNILVGLYEILGSISPDLADMGIAVIIFSIVIRIILFPLTIMGERSEEEKRKIVARIEEARNLYSHEPIRLRAEIKTIMHANARSVIATTANLAIGLAIIIMLYRIFTTGLEGADFYLLYDFVPNPGTINLMFLGKYDLSHTNATLNLIQSIMIFVVEVLAALRSPFPISRKDKAILQIFLPIGSFIIFMFLPAGKKIFMITTLAFSAIYHVIKLLQEWSQKLIDKYSPRPLAEPQGLTLTEASTPSVSEGRSDPTGTNKVLQ